MRVRVRTLLAVLAGVLAVATFVVLTGAVRYGRAHEGKRFLADGFEVVGHHDLDGRSGFKMAMQVVAGRWYLYLANMSEPGWTILDVTDPARPEMKAFVAGPQNTMTVQIQMADGLMVTGLERPIFELAEHLPWEAKTWMGWRAVTTGKYYAPWRPSREGVWIWDVRDPVKPKRLGEWATGATGTHRNFYDGGRYAHLAASMPGFRGNIYRVLDLADPARPVEAARWFLPEQDPASGVGPKRSGYYLHGPAHVEGGRAYLPYGIGGMIILDVSDVRRPKLVGRLELPPDLGSVQGVHTVIPIPTRRIAIINSEPHGEKCRGDPGRNYAAIVDIADETAPRIVSFFPEPEPPPGFSESGFCGKGGRFGTHNQHHQQHQRHLFASDTLVYLTYFNAGLRLYDVSDATAPREIAYFIPPDPLERRVVLPETLVAQTEDVIVDARGYAYVTDKNQGIYVLRRSPSGSG